MSGAPTYKLVWTGDEETLERAGVILSDVLYPPSDAISLTKADPTVSDAISDWRLEAFFTEMPIIEAITDLLDAQDIGLAAPMLEEVPAIDWVAHALEGLGIVRAGRFLLYGLHDADKVAAEQNAIPIRIDANQAFGTGHHPTTAGCLELLDRLAGIAPKKILDLGCGSAVLAIAAAKLWNRQVLASDIDETSTVIARENVALNGVADLVDVVIADGFASTEIKRRTPFDFVFANILAGPLVEFAPEIAKRLSVSGRVMLAGLMKHQEERVTNAKQQAGFRLLNRLDHETWPVLLFVKL